MRLALPYPPSVNHYWRMVRTRHGCRVLISREGRAYRTEVGSILAAAGVRRMNGRLDVCVTVHPPDRRRRDLDNAMKALLDALEHGGAYEDDSQIDHLDIRRGPVVREGKVAIQIEPISSEHV
jgi:crossover junction endodeoxyribonuclease RusA